MSLATKYRPQEFSSVCEQDTIINIVSRLCEQEDLENRNFLFIGPAGCGKAEPLTSKILTTSGFKLMKDIQIGDEVFTGSGNCGKVTGIYPQGVRPIYRITLQDRTFIDVSDEHLNVVYRYNEDKKQRQDYVVTTKDLIELFNKSRFKLRIDVPEVNWEHKDVPIDPYLLGALIGDGSLSEGNCVFSNSEYDIVNKVDQKLRDNFNCYLDKNEGDNVDYSIRRLDRCKNKYVYSFKGELFSGQDSVVNKLVSLGYPKFDPATIHRFILKGNNKIAKNYPELIGSISIVEDYSENFQVSHPVVSMLSDLGLNTKSVDKHIPEMYLMNSKEVRLELLQGLFDTDGYISKEGSAVYTTCSSKLSEDFAFLVRSLGIRDTVVSYPAKYKVDGEWIFTGSTAYDHNLKIPNELEFCTSNKHLSRRMLHQNPPMRNIVSIERIEDEECQCIMIGHPDHTYISSEGFIPTHNTTTARIMAKVLNEGKENSTIEMDAASHNGVESVREIINQARMYPVGTKYKVFIIDECHAFSPQAWQIWLKPLEDAPAKSIYIFCTTNPEKIPATIISRVQTFQLSKISLKGIFDRLCYIIEQENREGAGITYTDDAVNYISKLASGGMRDAITNLDKVLAFTHDLTSESVAKALNLPEYDDYFKLLGAYSKRDNKTVSEVINNVYNSGVNFVKWFEGFHSFVMNVVKYIFLQDINLTMIPSHYQSKISKYGTAHSVVCLKLANKLLKLNYELKTTQYLQEVALTYLCQLPKKGE